MFDQAATNMLKTLSKMIGRGTYFVSHIDEEWFSVLKVYGENQVKFVERERKPLQDAY